VEIVARRKKISTRASLHTFFSCQLFRAGVDVMITIFSDFCKFSAKNLALFSKTNVMITIFAKTSSSLSKIANIFAKFYGEHIFKIITSVPGDGQLFLTTLKKS
jgi:hypothetical protein